MREREREKGTVTKAVRYSAHWAIITRYSFIAPDYLRRERDRGRKIERGERVGEGGREREEKRESHWLIFLCNCPDSKGYPLISLDIYFIVSCKCIYTCTCLDPWL